MSLSVEECLRRIGRLPHAGVIDPENALRWVRLTMGIDPERIGWHIARAGGIGGSEAGTVLSWAYGDFHSRNTAERMGKQKLLVLPPERANDDMSRGAYLEDHIKAVYEARLTRDGRKWRERLDLKKVIEASPHPELPFLRASLDGIYEIDGAIVITDFKAPSEESLDGYVKHRDFHDYVAQLNHYHLVAEGHGVRVDALELAMYDYRRVASVGCQVFPIAIDPVLQQKIVSAASSFWNDYVMMGCYPEEAEEAVLQADAGIPNDIEQLARRTVVNKMVADKATKDYEAGREEIGRWVGATGTLGDGMLPLGRFADEGFPDAQGFLQVRAERVFDTARAVQRLRDLGVPDKELEAMRGPDKYDSKKLPAAYDAMVKLLARVSEALSASGADPALLADVDKALKRAPVREKGDFDEEKLAAALDSLHETPYSFFTEKISSGLPRGKRLDLDERRAVVAERLQGVVNVLAACEQAPGELPEGPAPR